MWRWGCRMQCPYCGSNHVDYIGVDDGGGNYGTSVCDIFHCGDCEMDFEANCIDTEEDFLDWYFEEYD